MTAWQLVVLHGLVVWGAIAAMCYAMPRLTRPELYFAVTVPAAFRERDEARAALRDYRRRIARNAALALLAIAAGVARHQPAWFEVAALGQLIGQIAAFLVARRAIAPFAVAPTSVREAQLAPRPGLPGGVAAQVGPFALLAFAALQIALGDIAAPRAYGELGVAALGCGLVAVIAYYIAHGSRQIAGARLAREREQQFRRVTLLVLLAAEYVTVGRACVAALWHRRELPAVVHVAVGLVTLGVALITTVVLSRLGQGGARHAPAGAAPLGDGSSDAHWKWGVFYVNPEDPAVFVEKRFGIGYTINLGSRRGRAVTALVVATAVIATVAQFLLRRA